MMSIEFDMRKTDLPFSTEPESGRSWAMGFGWRDSFGLGDTVFLRLLSQHCSLGLNAALVAVVEETLDVGHSFAV